MADRPERDLADRLGMVLADSPVTLSITLINAGLLAFVHSGLVPAGHLTAWLVFMLAVAGGRAALYLRYRKSGVLDVPAAKTGTRHLLAAMAATGIGWGAGSIVLIQDAPATHQVFTAFVLGGMAAGGLPTLARIWRVYAVFVVPALLPEILYFAALGTQVSLAMAAMGCLFLGFLLIAGRRHERTIVESLRLREENGDLIRRLTAEREKALADKDNVDRLNAELRREVAGRSQIEQRLQERERMLQTAQEIAGLSGWEWNVETGLISCSKENNLLFGRPPDYGPYRLDDAYSIVHPDDLPRLDAAVQESLQTGLPYRCDYRIRLPDGSERVLVEQAVAIVGGAGKVSRIVGINYDITERYRTAERLRVAVQAAEAASQAKSQFLANMSHELRTPLNAIIGYSEILHEDLAARGLTENVADLDRINQSGRHLLTLVDEVLDFARIEAGRTDLHVEPVSIPVLLDEVAGAVRQMVAANGNRLVVECPPDIGELVADRTKLRQILSNLLSNAAKFTEAGDIRLAVSAIRDRAPNGGEGREWTIFRVSDTGIGIAPGDMESIFAPFERTAEGRNPKYGGTGLGLAICRNYCELMGGAVSAESEPGKGAVFTVRLPRKVPARPAPA